jgi:hypothetical protein
MAVAFHPRTTMIGQPTRRLTSALRRDATERTPHALVFIPRLGVTQLAIFDYNGRI